MKNVFRLFISCSFLVLLLRTSYADYKQAVQYYYQGKYDKAIQELKPDLDANPDWETGHRLVGLCYLNLKNNALAVSSLTRAVQLKSTAFSTYFGLGQAYFNMQKYDYCVLALNQGEPFLAKENTKDQDNLRYGLYHLRGAAQYRLGKYNDAANDYTAALRIKQADWVDFSELGFAYYSLNRFDEAIQALQKAASMKPGQAAVTETIGKAYFRKGVEALKVKQYSQAVESFTKAKEYNPSDAYISANLGEAYIFQKRFPEAEKALAQALVALPNSADVYMRMGLAFEMQKKWDLALNAYKNANQLNPAYGQKDIDRVTENKKAVTK
ncbi:MAG TPA: tetratricopeptide repeat protein [Acidobacteriota bacterium]|nr:tetratricopeptide repeat protein [Acidobacteriota bacterium]